MSPQFRTIWADIARNLQEHVPCLGWWEVMFSHTGKKIHQVNSGLRMVKAGLAASQRRNSELTFRFRRKIRKGVKGYLYLDTEVKSLGSFLYFNTMFQQRLMNLRLRGLVLVSPVSDSTFMTLHLFHRHGTPLSTLLSLSHTVACMA